MLSGSTAAPWQRGATLIEVAVTLVVLGIVIALAGPNLGQFLVNQRVRANADAMLNGFQLARAEALRRNARVIFTASAGGGWTIGCETVLATCSATIHIRSAEESSAAVTFVPTPTGATTVTFTELGRRAPSNADATPPLESMLLSTLLSGARNLRVDITSGGSIRMCDTALPSGDARAC